MSVSAFNDFEHVQTLWVVLE